MPTNGLDLIQTQSASSSTSIVFSTGISSTYNNYLLTADNISSASNTTDSSLLIQLSTNGGSTYDTTNYYVVGIGSITTGLVVLCAVPGDKWAFNSASGSSHVILHNMTSGSGFVGSRALGFVMDNSGNPWLPEQYGEFCYLTTANKSINAFRIVMSDGAAFTGSLSLYGYNK